MVTNSKFIDDSTIQVIAKDGELFTFKSIFPVPPKDQNEISLLFSHYFDEFFSVDKSLMVYDVFNKMTYTHGFGFSYQGSDRSEERMRIGARIRQLREERKMEARELAVLSKIDPANLSRIEQGKLSVGFDILTKIADVLGVKVDLV